jgi:hypothetical protein
VKIIIASFALTLTCASFNAYTAVDEAETRRLLDIYQGTDKLAQKKNAERLTYWAVEEPALYARINQLILENYSLEGRDREQIDYVAWLLKGLATSGDEQYRGTLETVAREASHGKVRKYANIALDDLDTYKRWNPLVNRPIPPALAITSFQQRNYYNMIVAPDLELVRIGAKRIHFESLRHPALATVLNERILTLYANASDALEVDTVAWLLKALATCGGTDYSATFSQVTPDAGHRKIRKYAATYAKAL